VGEAQGLRESSQASESQVGHYFPDPGRHAERPATTFIEVAGLLLGRARPSGQPTDETIAGQVA
jgi:hypothetical protein